MIDSLVLASYLWALGQIESCGNDAAVGSHGEVSRFQIMPDVWRANSTELCQPTNPVCAGEVAERVWMWREAAFYKRHHRKPTTRQWYLLWHCPGRVDHPTKADLEIAGRFENLVNAKVEARRVNL